VVASIVVAVVVVAVLGASLLAPVPKSWDWWAVSRAVWRRTSIRQRWHRRRPGPDKPSAVGAATAVVLAVWVLPPVLTREPPLDSAAERHKAIADTRTCLVAMLAALGAAGASRTQPGPIGSAGKARSPTATQQQSSNSATTKSRYGSAEFTRWNG
jgi:hypothetical protein